MKASRVLLWAGVLWMAAGEAAGGAPLRHNRIVAVPVPARTSVRLDGRLDEWDLSGAIECAYDEALRPRFTVRAALMYDGGALYVGAAFADDTPLRNRHDPSVEPNRGWSGDCLQVRLCSDAKADWPLRASKSPRICHLTLWQFTDKKLPVLQVQYGMDYHGTKVFTGKAAQVAFAACDGGYTLEARIPWGRLNAAADPPKAKETIGFVLQPLWSDASGLKHAVTFNDVIRKAGFSFQNPATWGQAVFSPHGKLKAAERPRTAKEKLLPLRLALPKLDAEARTLSAAVFDGRGRLVRSLGVVAPGAGEALPASLSWDGLDDDGRPLPPGDYALKVLTHRGVGQRYVASLHSAGTPPWRTDDGRGAWGGDHAPPAAAAADAERVYLGWGVSEAGWAVIAAEPKLRSPASAQKIWGVHQVLELGIVVTAVETDGKRVFVAQDGKRWGQKKGTNRTCGVVLWDAKTGRPVNFPFGKRTLVAVEWDCAGKEGLNLRGLAVEGEQLFVSLHHENKVAAFNWRTGKKVREYAVADPGGLDSDAPGGLWAVSGRRVVRIDLESGRVEPVMTTGLSEPQDVTAADGRLYVSDRGDAMQVKVFEGGKLVGTIGKAGGRAAIGRYDPAGMRNPAGIAIDRAGKLWVAEQDNCPRRISVWSKQGKLLGDLLGPGAYAVEGIADPAHPRWINTHWTLFELDYRTGRAKTVATLIRPQDGQIRPAGGYMGRALVFRHARGHDYLIWRGHHLVIVYLLSKELTAQPVAAAGWLKDTQLYGLTPELMPEQPGAKAFQRRYDYGFTWTDRNGDTKLQPAELVVQKPPAAPWGCYWGSWVDRDLTIWTHNRSGRAVWRIPVAQWLDGGRCAYPPPGEQKPLFTLADTKTIHYVLPGRGGVYVLEDLKGKGGAISLCRLDGRRVWSYRRVWTGFGLNSPLSRPGDVCGAMRFIGRVDLGGEQFVAVNGYFGQFNVLSSRGLWVASLCKDNRYGPKADENTVWPENFSGWFYRNRDDGRVYLIAGDTDTRVWEVTGLEHVRTVAAAVSISAADRERAVAAAQRKRGAAAGKRPLRLRRSGKVTVDGALGEWGEAAAARIDVSGRAAATVRLAYDDANLYAAFDVTDASPMRNGGADAALLFKTGDSCNLMLATNPRAPADRTRPAAGDLRLLFAEAGGKGLCVLYEAALSPGRERSARVFSSPTGVAAFDRVVVLEGAKVAVRRKKGGYTLEASVPLKALGFAPPAGGFTRADVGVIFSDAGGSRNVLRAYYADDETAIINDIPSEARLRPHKWALLEVGR